MKQTQSLVFRASAVSLAVVGLLMAGSAYAGKIDNLNNNPATLGACVALDNPATTTVNESTLSPAACVGAWNLDNVDVKLVKIDTGAESDFFDKITGVYTAMTYGDSFVSIVKDSVNGVMARLAGKDWPVGEPTGIRAVNGDNKVSNGKPENCLINTAYLGAINSSTGANAYLDSATPEPVVCSSGFQSHKRFKIAMQPATVDGITVGEGKPIDLVFNVKDEGSATLRPYQVFSKINNYTDKRLGGYKIVVGRGLGTAFQSAGALGIANKLHLSLGLGEGASKSEGVLTPNGTNLFEGDGLATFSHGLFGAIDKNFLTNGFFDTRTAGFGVDQACSEFATKAECTFFANPYAVIDPTAAPLLNSDTIYSTSILPSNYTTLFGDWLPSKWQPSGIFFDDDNDPTTDPVLMAWWNGSSWLKNNDSGSVPVTEAELSAWANNPLYEVAKIEDVLNLGINYIVKVGDINTAATVAGGDPNTFTLRIIPVVAADQSEPSFLGTEPTPLEPTLVTQLVTPPPPVDSTGGGGGGCSAGDGNALFDPVLWILAALGLGGWIVRRVRRQ